MQKLENRLNSKTFLSYQHHLRGLLFQTPNSNRSAQVLSHSASLHLLALVLPPRLRQKLRQSWDLYTCRSRKQTLPQDVRIHRTELLKDRKDTDEGFIFQKSKLLKLDNFVLKSPLACPPLVIFHWQLLTPQPKPSPSYLPFLLLSFLLTCSTLAVLRQFFSSSNTKHLGILVQCRF